MHHSSFRLISFSKIKVRKSAPAGKPTSWSRGFTSIEHHTLKVVTRTRPGAVVKM